MLGYVPAFSAYEVLGKKMVFLQTKVLECVQLMLKGIHLEVGMSREQFVKFHGELLGIKIEYTMCQYFFLIFIFHL